MKVSCVLCQSDWQICATEKAASPFTNEHLGGTTGTAEAPGLLATPGDLGGSLISPFVLLPLPFSLASPFCSSFVNPLVISVSGFLSLRKGNLPPIFQPLGDL